MTRQIYNVEEAQRLKLEAVSMQLDLTNQTVAKIASAVGTPTGGGSDGGVIGSGGDGGGDGGGSGGGGGGGGGSGGWMGGGGRQPQPPAQEQSELLMKLERALPGLVDMASQSESLAAAQERGFERIDRIISLISLRIEGQIAALMEPGTLHQLLQTPPGGSTEGMSAPPGPAPTTYLPNLNSSRRREDRETDTTYHV